MCSFPERPGRRLAAQLRRAAVPVIPALLAVPALWAATPSASFAQRPAAPAAVAQFDGIGRPATAKEIAAWDIDVRPDFKGLPKGRGSVAQGQEIWEAKCASCHGVFGESNETFFPLIGGTTAADTKSGRAARLTDESFPSRTTMMKLATVSTLWDYIRRAMPWNAPKSLGNDEVYAVTAFMLNLGGVLPDTFVLSDENIAEVQRRLPNRAGMTTAHGLWPGRGLGRAGVPDVRSTACMTRCATEPTVASLLPEHARNAHGNLAEQSRVVGAQRGADTTRAAGAMPVRAGGAAAVPAGAAATTATPTTAAPPATASAPAADPSAHAGAQALARKHNCLTCHGLDRKVVGPGLREVAKKYAGRTDASEYLARKIAEGSAGVWGVVPMPSQALPAADARSLAAWLAAGAP